MEIGLILGIIALVVSSVASLATNDTTNDANTRNVQDTNRTNQEIQRETNDLQMQLAGQTNDWSIAQWNRENAYNSPLAQIQRLRDAGINPALAYSNGLMNEAASSPAANMANVEAMRNIAPQIERPNLPDPLSASQIALNEAQAKATHDANLRQSELQPFVIDSMEAATSVSRSLSELNRQSIDESMSRIAVNRETASKLSEEAYSFVLDNKYKLDTMSMRERMVSNQSSISDMDVEYFRKNAEQGLEQSRALCSKLRSEAQAALAKKNLDETERDYIQKQVENYQHTLDNLDAETRKLNSEADLSTTENDIRKKYGEKEAEQKIKHLRQQRISGYVNSYTGGIRDLGVGFGAVIKSISN